MDRRPSDRLAEALSRFSRLGLAHLPTPLEPMKRLSAHLGGPRLWVKREDCTGLGLDGNKLRKLDYVLREAIDGGADILAHGNAAATLLGQPFDPDDVEVVAGHAGPAYGVPHDATVAAIRLGARLEGLVLDPVYSGKALAGLIALVRAGRWTDGQDVVFTHTGGVPALFAYRHLFD